MDHYYKTIVADPPWTPSLGAGWKTRFTDKARPQKHYSTMSVDELCQIKVPSEKQSHLWLWVINQHVDWGYKVSSSWGFEVCQMVTWCKPGLGTGRFQCNSESVLVCRKGIRHGNPFGMSGGTHFSWDRGRHSEKPNGFYDLVERVSPGPYLEMFARKIRPRWDSWGDEIASTVEISVTNNITHN